jgi:hypothetical protein
MGASAVGAAFDECWSLSGAGAGDGSFGHFGDGEHVITIDFESGHAVGSAAVADAGVTAGVTEGDFGGELIIFADKEDREFPD